MILPQIINSLLENDMYKFSMGQCIYHQFSAYKTTWTFKCRNTDVFFTTEMVEEIKAQIRAYCDLRFTEEELNYLENVKAVSKIPVMMGFGIRTAEDVAGLKDTIDGCIVGTHFIELMEENNYDLEVAKEYIRTFKKELNA